MLVKEFPYNPLIKCIEYNSENRELNIHFKKGEIRQYAEVEPEVFYGAYYLKTAKELMSYYTKKLRKKYKLLNIKNHAKPNNIS